MNSKLATICAGFIWSVLFGTARGMLAGGFTFGMFGVVGATIAGEGLNPEHLLGGFIYLGFLGGIVGATAGLASGSIGWLPSVLFREYPRMSYGTAVLFGTVVGIYAYYLHAISPNTSSEFSAANFALILLSSIFGGISSNYIVRIWVVDVHLTG